MDELSTNTVGLKKIIELLEENKLLNHITKNQKYTTMLMYISKEGYVDYDVFQKVLNLCVHEMEQDIKCTAMMLKIIITILKKIKDEVYSPDPSILVPSAVYIIHKMNVTASLSNVENLRDLYITTLLLYPDETLISLVSNHEATIIELFKSHNYAQSQLEFKILLYDFMHKLLTVLPSEIKLSFVSSMTPILFSKVIPSILEDISCIIIQKDVLKYVEVLETIANELSQIDYFELPQWMSFLEDICNTKKYPHMLKNLLDKECPLWHRLWIVFIKLLKNQITMNLTNGGTPINSILPVVETAFKLDPKNRIRAFQCWTILTNILSYETNENCINKRLKLLIIPLKLNNAKLEETAVAKFDSWWHLINKFQFKLDKFLEPILISFLHYCFGNYISRTSFIPGELSHYLKEQSVNALVEIIGHVNCTGCVEIMRLKEKVLNSRILNDYCMDWIYSLKVAIQYSMCNINDSVPQRVLCLLRSFLLTMSELPDSKIKQDMMCDLLSMLLDLVQDSKQKNIYYADTVFELLLSFFIDELNMKDFLCIKDEKWGTLYKIIKLTLDPCLKKFYERHDKGEAVQKLKPLAKYILQDPLGLQHIMDNILNSLPTNDITLIFWTTLVECIRESDNEYNLQNVFNILIWPLESLNMFNRVKYPAKSWYTTYSIMHLKFSKGDFDRDISRILHSSNIVTNSSIYFALYVTLAILKCGLTTENTNKYEMDIQLLQVLSKRIDCYEDIEELFPLLVDTLVHILHCYTVSNVGDLAETVVSCVKNVLKLMVPVFKSKSDINEISTIMENLFNAVDLAFKSQIYSKLFYILSDFTTFYASIFPKLTLSIFTKSSFKNKNSINKYSDVIANEKLSTKQITESNNFSTPPTKEIKKKRKKTEDSVVKTVVENGEEFVVVQSNWKFNPNKLTENQKEKLQRKREDIPALYQDLSQSQDDINLKPWKTDSQDTTITSSNSCSKTTNVAKDASSILKNLASTEVVPKILENILITKGNNESDENKAANKEIDKQVTNRNCGTPRMALKDRVFRNVRCLIEKSKNESVSEDSNQIENICRTPSPTKVKTDVTSLVKSAPPLPISERPSRVKRKPRKFDDVQTYALKKRRLHSYACKDGEIINEKLSMNITDYGSKYENGNVKENSSIIENMQGDLITEDKVLTSKTENIENVKNYVRSIPIIENTNTLNVKLVENGIDKVTDNTNCTIEDISHDQKCNQSNPSKEQESKNECPSTFNLSENNSTEQKSPTSDINDVHKSSVKGINSKRKSRIQNELAIDMVIEYCNKTILSNKRLTRKNLATPIDTSSKIQVTDKLKQSPVETNLSSKQGKKEKPAKKNAVSIKVIETQDESTTQDKLLSDDVSSEDVIESSQDSTLTTCTIIKKTPKKIPNVCIENVDLEPKLNENNAEIKSKNLSQDQCEEIITTSTIAKEFESFSDTLLEKEAYAVSIEVEALDKSKDGNTAPQLHLLNDTDCQNTKSDSLLINGQSKDDTELPQNKTDYQNKSQIDSTENMNTEEIFNSDLSDVVIIDNERVTVAVSSEEDIVGINTQEIADAVTQPINPAELLHSQSVIYDNTTASKSFSNDINENGSKTISTMNIQNDENNPKLDNESVIISTTDIDTANHNSSPFKDDIKRKQDFMNSTLEISPIKTLSPNDYNEKPQSPDATPEFVVILLSSPVHSNGEPVDKESPEVFTEDKTAADKIELSPTRPENNISNTSPSSALSLKKNRPQVRAGGRAAQMLGLCVPEKLNSLVCPDKNDTGDIKRIIQNGSQNTPARRNLRMLYNSTSDNNDIAVNNEDNENFLKLNRLLPPMGCSPSGPILKRKLIEITDDATVSPANKRKRVSFHDPPVSTTVSVQKYIEPIGVRSPQNSMRKRYERQPRSQNGLKSPRRLDNLFNLNTALTKAVESFTDSELPATNNDNTQMTSLEQTPAAEIVKTSELNDTEPICLELLNCEDPIENIAAELSSAAMKPLLIKELQGKIETIGDLAKMTEVEVNRLCIKAPKVNIAKRALYDYYSKLVNRDKNIDNTITLIDIELVEDNNDKIGHTETQTDKIIYNDAEIQTASVPLSTNSMQTDITSTSTTCVQTDESGFKSTVDIIKTCILERHDFLEQLTEQLGESEMQMVVEKLSFNATTELYMKKINVSNANTVLSCLLDHKCIQRSSDKEPADTNQLSFLRNYLQERFSSKDLNLFCIQLLLELHNKSV